MIGHRTPRCLLLLAVLSSAGPAGAREPTPALAPAAPPASTSSPGPAELPSGGVEVTEARDAFRRGSALAKAGDWQGALAAFQRSARLKPHPVTTYDIAYCERALGRYARASFRFEEALAVPPGETAPALPPELARDAETYLEEVRRRVVRVTVTLRPANLAIRVDGRGLLRMSSVAGGGVHVVGESDVATTGLGPGPVDLWLDPGSHVFVLMGAGDAHAVESRTFLAGERAELSLSLAPAAVSTGKRRENAGSSRAAPQSSPDRTAAFIAFGVGSVGLVGGAVFAGLALGEKHSLDADGACFQKQCPPDYRDRESRMVTYADFATAGLVTLVVGAGAGTFFLLTAKPSKSSGARVVPWFVGTAAGVAGRF